MSRSKPILLSGFVTLVVCACISASASAGLMHWYTAGGPKLTESTLLLVTGASGLKYLLGVAAGIVIEIDCKHSSVHGNILNPSGGWAGLGLALLRYYECSVGGGAGTTSCLVSGNEIHMFVTVELEGTNAAPTVQIFPDPDESAPFGSITFDSCTQTGLNRSWPLEGSMLGKINNAMSAIEIDEAKASSMLFFANAKARFLGTIELFMEGGGNLEVKE
jgi:hypothetical protein